MSDLAGLRADVIVAAIDAMRRGTLEKESFDPPLDALIAAAREEGRREGEGELDECNAALGHILGVCRDAGLVGDDAVLMGRAVKSLAAAHAAQLVALREEIEEWIAKTIGPRDAQRFYSDCKRGIIPLPDAEAALEKVREGAVRDFLAKGPGGGYEVAAPFEGGPLTRVRRRGWQGHEWGFAYPEQARAVANALNALGAKGREQ